MLLPAVTLLLRWVRIVVVEEVIIGRGIVRSGVAKKMWFMVTGNCSVELYLLSGEGRRISYWLDFAGVIYSAEDISYVILLALQVFNSNVKCT